MWVRVRLRIFPIRNIYSQSPRLNNCTSTPKNICSFFLILSFSFFYIYIRQRFCASVDVWKIRAYFRETDPCRKIKKTNIWKETAFLRPFNFLVSKGCYILVIDYSKLIVFQLSISHTLSSLVNLYTNKLSVFNGTFV